MHNHIEIVILWDQLSCVFMFINRDCVFPYIHVFRDRFSIGMNSIEYKPTIGAVKCYQLRMELNFHHSIFCILVMVSFPYYSCFVSPPPYFDGK